MRTVTATRYVTPLREGGSLPAIIEADDDGLYVLKFHRAGQGPRALVAELLAGELARELGLPVPELVFVELDAALGRAEPDPEIQELVVGSAGLNLALDYLPGSITFSPAADQPPSPELAADIVWFDSLVTNPDRMPQNPNLLVWHGDLWLIDHGAALYVHHSWQEPQTHARQPFEMARDHVLLPFAGSITEADEHLAGRIDRALLERLVALVPDAWLGSDDPSWPSPEQQRSSYVDYLLLRLQAPRTFLAPLEEARSGA